MFKIVSSLLLTTFVLFAQTISFREGKFVDAIALYTYRDGNVTYDDNKTVIRYEDGKTITKVENIIEVKNEKNELLTTIDSTQKPEVELYFSLTKSLFEKDFEVLKENFKIKKIDKKHFFFQPQGEVANVIKKLELLLKEDERVEALILNFNNGDKIKIEAK